ncbi:MAG TPA: hypothetical protein PK109_03385 [Candidatus Paceibacterota bacterium]|nr:hypothetical protein [Candidatus Paceibacterota bacterium]
MSEKGEGQLEKKGPTRRGVLSGMGNVAKGIWAFNAVAWTAIGAQEIYKYRGEILDVLLDAQHAGNENVQSARRFLKELYGVEVLFGKDHQNESYEAAGLTAYEAQRGLSAIISALMKYPHDFFKENPLTPVIRIGKGVALHHENETHRVGGFASQEEGYFMIEYQERLSTMVEIFHHEFYHILDARHASEKRDAEWKAINAAAGYTYSGDVFEDPAPYRSEFLDLFSSAHGAANPQEDRAEIAERLMTIYGYWGLTERLEDMEDGPIKEALERKIALVKEDFRVWSNGTMDEAFWLRIERESLRSAEDFTYEPLGSYTFYPPPSLDTGLVLGEPSRVYDTEPIVITGSRDSYPPSIAPELIISDQQFIERETRDWYGDGRELRGRR